MTFSEPTQFDLSPLKSFLSRYLGDPQAGADGMTVVFPLQSAVTFKHFRDGNAVVIDLYDTYGDRGTPPASAEAVSEHDTVDHGSDLTVRQEGLSYEEALPLERTDPQEIAEPNVADINTALAALDLASFVPAGVPSGEPPAWRRHAVPTSAASDRPAIAVIIDDLGLNRPNTHRTLALPAPLTLAFLTYAEGLQPLADAARSAGHELLVHVPMAPLDPQYKPGPNVLRADLDREELARRLAWALSRFDGYVGINNQMGSDFTTSVPGMAQVMIELKARGLLYLDSFTVPGTVGAALAERLGVPYAKRNVFIDNDPRDRAAIRRQLARLEQIATRYGKAVGIGHPHDATLDELTTWLPEVQRRGFRLVPISALIQQRRGFGLHTAAGE